MSDGGTPISDLDSEPQDAGGVVPYETVSPTTNSGFSGSFNNQDINGLLSGYAWNATNITFSFPTSASDYGASYSDQAALSGWQALSASQQTVVLYALNLISQYTDLTFTQITETPTTHATIRFSDTSSSGDPTSYTYYPGNSDASGDVWYGNSILNVTPTGGSYAFDSILHEIGHSVGLKHGQDDVAPFGTLPTAHNSTEYSLMDYYSYPGGPALFSNYTGSGAMTYMVDDIAALQYLYGANYNTNSGNTVYTWNPNTGAESINGVVQPASSTNTIYESVWDGGGTDTYDLSNYTTNLSINLNPGAWSTFSQAQLAHLDVDDSSVLAPGNVDNANLYEGNTASLIENAIGGSGNDIIIGNAANNNLQGGAGNDTITGGPGNDTIDGGPGIDTAVYSGASNQYQITRLGPASFQITDERPGSPDGTDTLTNVEFAQFSDTTVSLPVSYNPIVTTANVTEVANHTIALSSLFTVSDPNGYAITEYQVWDSTSDPNSGYFLIDGNANAAQSVITFSASDLARAFFVTGTVGDNLQIRAYDGTAWSAADNAAWSPFTVSIGPDHPPVVTAANVTEPRNQTIALSSLFSVSDVDGDAITQYQLLDSTSDPNSGHFVINGVVQAAGSPITITAAQLAQTSFVTGIVGDSLQISAFDGTDWSTPASFTVSLAADHPPVVTTANLSDPAGKTLPLSGLFSVSDADGDTITQYQILDSTTDPNSGYFVINGAVQTAGSPITITAAQLAQTSFVTGTVGDSLQISAFDGTDWSTASAFTISILPPGGTITYANGSTDSSPIVLDDNNTQLQVATGTATQSGLISEVGGSYGLAKTGAGTLIYTANNTYSGTTTIAAGTLQIGSGSTGGSLGTGAVVDNGELNFNQSSASITEVGNISGTGNVTFSGAGSGVTLTGNNTYTGGTTISGGPIIIGNGGTTGSITGDVVDGTTANGTGINFRRSDNVTFSGNISGQGYLDQQGTGILTLTGNNTYSSETDIENGRIAISSASNLGTGDLIKYFFGILQFNGAVTLAQNVISGAAASGGGFDTNGNNDVLSGVLSSYPGVPTGSGGLNKYGAGTLTLTGANNYTGPTIISGGTLQIGGSSTSGTLGTGAVTDNADLEFDRSDTIAVANVISGTGTVAQIGSGTLTLTGADTYTGVTTISAGTLALSGSGSIADSSSISDNAIFDISQSTSQDTSIVSLSGNGTVVLGSKTLAITNGAGDSTSIFSGVIQGGGMVDIAGGMEAFTGSNAYSGTTLIESGAALFLGLNTATGSLGSGDVLDNGRLVFGLTSASTFNASVVGTGEVDQFGSGVVSITQGEGYGGQTLIGPGSTLALSGSGSIAISSAVIDDGGTFDISGTNSGASIKALGHLTGSTGDTVDLGNKTLTISAGSSLVFSGVIQDGGIAGGTGGGLTLSGGVEGLTGANTYTGLTTIANGASLVIGNNGATGSLGSGLVTDNGTLVYGLTSDTTVGNTISGSGGFTQAGSDAVTLNGTDTYNGGTSVNSGTLSVTGSIVNSSVTVASGATLTGSGTVGATTIQNGGILMSGGPNIATLNVNGNLSLASGSDYADYVSPSSTDETVVSGSANLGGTLFVNFASGSYTLGTTYTLLNAAGGVSGSFANVQSLGLPSGMVANVTYDTDNAYLTLSRNAATDHAPVVTTTNVSSRAGRTLSLSSLFTVSDADGDAITQYQLWDSTRDPNSGYFEINGVAQPAGTVINVSAAELAQTNFVTGTVGASLQIRAFDGTDWSAADNAAWAPFTITVPADNPPVVTTANLTEAANQTLALSSLFTVSDADGDTITQYQLWDGTRDPNSGYFVVNGVTQPAGTVITISAAQLAQTSFVTGTDATSLQIRAFDGTDWSAADNAAWAPFTISPPVNHPPVVTTANLNEPRNTTLALSSLFTVSDQDGDTITQYQLWDETRDPASGNFVVNGVTEAPGTVITISAAQLAQTSFVTGTVGDNLQIRAFDGQAWSAADNAAWAPFTITVPANHPPVVTTTNLTEAAGQTLALSSLFSVSDADGDTMTQYQLWDSTRDPNAGYFAINGVAQPAGTVITIGAAQLAQTTFVTGTVATSLQIRAFDGTDWSAADNASWSPFTVSPPVSGPPVVTTANLNEPRNTSLALSSLFSVSDPDGSAITEYQLWDSTRDPASGNFVVNGVTQAPGTVVTISAAQLAQTTFQTGTVGDSLQIRAFDGTFWSAADNASWSPFTISVPADNPPVVTTSNVTEPANTSVPLSNLFSVSDADGDAITQYQLWDSTSDPNSGHFAVNGVAQPASTVISISAAQLAQTTFVTGSVGDNLQIRAFDGTLWSAADTAAWAPFHVAIG